MTITVKVRDAQFAGCDETDHSSGGQYIAKFGYGAMRGRNRNKFVVFPLTEGEVAGVIVSQSDLGALAKATSLEDFTAKLASLETSLLR
jgi:hypothetical protein